MALGSDAFVRPSLPPSTFSARTVAYSGVSVPPRRHSSHRSLSLSTSVSAGPAPPVSSAPSVKAPPDMYHNAVNVGQKKAASTAPKTFLMGIISGCHIAFGALLAVTVGGNCPGLAASNPGLQKILFGAFGRCSRASAACEDFFGCLFQLKMSYDTAVLRMCMQRSFTSDERLATHSLHFHRIYVRIRVSRWSPRIQILSPCVRFWVFATIDLCSHGEGSEGCHSR